MNFIFWTLTIAALILLLPIPIKLTLIFDEGIIILKVYNKTVVPSARKNKKKKQPKKKNKKKYIKTPAGERIKKFKIRDMKDLIRFLANTKLKFFLWTDINISYSIEDAAINAIAYGLLSQASAYYHILLKKFFYLKKYKCNVMMTYNENFFKVKSNSIILINLATIIYIMAKIFYTYILRRYKTSKVNLT